MTPLTKEELTAFVKEVIVILEEDTTAAYLTSQESFDYIRLLLHASKHIFHKHPDYHEGVLQVTKPLIKLPSVELRETKETLDRAYADIADKDAETGLRLPACGKCCLHYKAARLRKTDS